MGFTVFKRVVTLGLAIPAVQGLYIGGGLTILTRNELDSNIPQIQSTHF